MFGIALCGVLLDATGSWEASLYAPLIGGCVLAEGVCISRLGGAMDGVLLDATGSWEASLYA